MNLMKQQFGKTIIWLSVFGIAMAYVESVVVVYLRIIYYPEGFSFPLQPISQEIAAVEFWREAATLFMLLAVGVLAGKTAAQHFSLLVVQQTFFGHPLNSVFRRHRSSP